MKSKPKLKPAAITRRRLAIINALANRNDKLQKTIAANKRQAAEAIEELQGRCNHTRRISPDWQYAPSVDYCPICGKEFD